MHQLSMGGIKLPKLYICDNPKDVQICRTNGIPYLVWHGSDQELIKLVMLPTLRKMFPSISWNKTLGVNSRRQPKIVVPEIKEKDAVRFEDSCSFAESDSNAADSAEDYRYFDGSIEVVESKLLLGSYVGDLSSQVNIEQLQDLKLLPKFLDDIATNISKNIADYVWWEGYNKVRKVPIGNFQSSSEAPNLVIIDVSASIPRGISDTMLVLAETLRAQCNADLIITGGTSYIWKAGEKLPTPEKLRNIVPPSNESDMFYEILKNDIAGRTFGNVVCFGDNDTPLWRSPDYQRKQININLMRSVKVNAIWGYHTHKYTNNLPGYCLWAQDTNPKAEIHLNHSWCNAFDK